MALGYGLSYGAGASSDALAELVAQRQRDQQLALQARDQAARERFWDEQLRQRDEGVQEERTLRRISLTPIGAEASPEQVEADTGYGLGSLYERDQGPSPTGEPLPFRFAGTPEQQEATQAAARDEAYREQARKLIEEGTTSPKVKAALLAQLEAGKGLPSGVFEEPDPGKGMWVTRGGRPAYVRETDIQPGDAPYEKPSPPAAKESKRIWVMRGGQPAYVPEDQIQPGDAPYEKGAGGPAKDAGEAYAAERQVRTRDLIQEIKPMVGRSTTGWGSLLANVPETDARNLKAKLDALKANIGFNELTEMRQASKTGGALGQVSNIELGLLTSVLGSLDQGQSPAQLQQALSNIEGILSRWESAKAMQGTNRVAPGGVGPTPPAPKPSEFRPVGQKKFTIVNQ